MRGVVVYDSVYGNTKRVAELIAGQLRSQGHVADLVNVKDALTSSLAGDVLFIGSPTRMGTMTGRTKKLLKRIDEGALRGRRVCAFDTEGQAVIESNGASAAAKIHDMARSRGAVVHTPVLKVGVQGVKGPLSSNAEEVVASYVKEFLATLATKASA